MRSSGRLVLVFVVGMACPVYAQTMRDSLLGQGVELSGILLLNAYYNDDLVNDHGVPWIVASRSPFDEGDYGASGSTVRQSRVLVTGWAADVLGADVEGELDIDFYGIPAESSRREPIPRIRRAVATIRWPHAWITFGQEVLPISPFDPSSYSTVSVPGFTASGNLSRWLPQVRLGVDAGTTVRVGIEAAAVAPRFDRIDDTYTLQPDLAEQSRRPFVQGRLLARWDADGTEGEFSVGGHYGWFKRVVPDAGVDSLGVTRAATVSARFAVASRIEFRGEAFLGEGLGMLGGGGIDQTLGPGAGQTVRTRGGWAQLNIHPSGTLEIGGGYGLDDPEEDDIDPADGRILNVSWELHCHVHARPLILALEYRRLETTYADRVFDLQTANHVNMALGFEF